jgi:hypothetical protein
MMRSMQRPSWHRPRVLLLALLLGLGTSLSGVHSGVMAAEMTVTADEAHDRQGGCDGCGGGGHEGMDAGTCLAVCGTAAQGLIFGELLTLPSASRTAFELAQLLLSGQSHSPDHGPPKILTLSCA